MTPRVAALLCVATATIVVRPANAAEPSRCGASGRPWVQVRASSDLPKELSAFVELLRAELSSRGLDLCEAADQGAPAPVAVVDVSPQPQSVTLTVEVRDALTAKHVSRDVSLAAIPRDGRPLTVALAADELLRASWAELALKTAPPPARPVPVQVTRAVRDALPPPPAFASMPSARRLQLGVGFAWEHFAHGTTLYGADARLGARLTRRLEAAVRFGLRTGPSAAASDGAVHPSAWSAGLVAVVTLTPPEERWGVDAEGRADFERVTFVPTPRGAATGATQTDDALLTSLGPQGWFAVLPALRIGAEVLAVLPLRGVDATDAGTLVSGVAGLGWTAQVGLWGAL